jgi:hypothetical protein
MTTSDPGRPAKARRRHPTGNGGPHGVSTAAMARAARQMPRTVLREFDDHPAAVLVAIAGTSFVAGAILGSRLGRALLVALMPVGLSYAVRTGVGDELREWVASTLSRVEEEEED